MKSIYKSNGRVNDPFFKASEGGLISPMKILLVFMLALACSAFGQTHVHFSLPLFNANPSTNRIVDVQPLTPFKGNVTSYNTGTNSYFFLSNALAADYGVTIKQRGQAEAIQFQVTITSTNLGVVGAYTNTSVLGVQTHPTSGKAAWSILASDARYIPYGTAGVSVAAGTNATATTNGNLVTISAQAGGSTQTNISYTAITNLQALGLGTPGRFSGTLDGPGYDAFDVATGILKFNTIQGASGITYSGGVLGVSVVTNAYFYGNGSGLTNLNVAASLDPRFASSSGTITASSNTLAATTISATTVNATTVNGNGAGLTSLNASQLASGTVPTARLDTQLQNFVSSDSVRAASGSLEIGGQTTSDTVDFVGSLRGKGTLLTNAYGVFLAPTNAGTVGQVPTITADGTNMAFASVAGIGDLQAVNNLADVASTGQSRTNLGAHNANNLTQGTVAAARLPDLSTVYIATSTGNGTNTTLRSPVVLSELATNGINSSALIITSAVVNSSFIGTSNNTPLKFSVDATEALVIEREWPSQNFSTTFKNGSTNHSASGSGILSGATNTISGPMRDSVIAGGKYNTIEGLTNVFGGPFQYELGNSVIAGGLSNKITYHSTNSGAVGLAFIGGGERNTIYDNGFDHQIIVGGYANVLNGAAQSAIVGGRENEIHNTTYGTIGAGVQNVISNSSSSSVISGAVIIGGSGNTASGGNSVVAGGTANFAMKDGSFSAGQYARSLHTNTFVWADGSQPSGFSSTANRQFLVLATNGVGINTNSPGTNALSVHGSTRSTQFVLGTNSIDSWDDVTNYFTQSGGSSLQTGNATDATNVNLTVTGTLVAATQTNTTLSVGSAYFGYTNVGATFSAEGKLVGTNGVTQAGLAAGSYPINTITNSGTNFSVSFNYPPIAALGYPSWFFLTNKLLKFAGGTNTTDAFQFQWGPTANNYIDFGAASPGVNSAYSFLMRGYNAMGFECPSDFGTIRLGDDHRLDAQVKLSIQQVGEGLWYATNNFSGMLQFESRDVSSAVGKAAIRAKNATSVSVYSVSGQPYSQSELWLYTLAPPQLANSDGGFRSVGDTNWFMIGVTNSAIVKGLTISSNALSQWPSAPRTQGDMMLVNSNGNLYSLNANYNSSSWNFTNLLSAPTAIGLVGDGLGITNIFNNTTSDGVQIVGHNYSFKTTNANPGQLVFNTSAHGAGHGIVLLGATSGDVVINPGSDDGVFQIGTTTTPGNRIYLQSASDPSNDGTNSTILNGFSHPLQFRSLSKTNRQTHYPGIVGTSEQDTGGVTENGTLRFYARTPHWSSVNEDTDNPTEAGVETLRVSTNAIQAANGIPFSSGGSKGITTNLIVLNGATNPVYLIFTGGLLTYMGIDSDALTYYQAVTNAGGTLSSVQLSAINQFVVSRKANGTWTDADKIAPMLGGTAASHAIYLKGSGSISWVNTPTHNANGVTFASASSQYGDTGWSCDDGPSYTTNSARIVMVIPAASTTRIANNTHFMGNANTAGTSRTGFMRQNTTSIGMNGLNCGNAGGVSAVSTTNDMGVTIATRTSASLEGNYYWGNTTPVGNPWSSLFTDATASTTLVTVNFALGCRNFEGSGFITHSSYILAGWEVGAGVTSDRAQSIRDAWQSLQNQIGR
jgi:hypothetical protein